MSPQKPVLDNKRKTLTQSEAVLMEVKRVCGSNFTAEKTEAKKLLTTRDIDRIANSISDKIERKEVYYGKQIPERPILFRYVKTIIFNLLKKNRKLNGGKLYEPTTGRRKKMGRKSTGCSGESSALATTKATASTADKKARKEKEKAVRKKKPKEKLVEAISTVIYSDEISLVLARFEK
jgi:hypothetical protein